jgi:transposase InsO family protein
MEYFRKLAETGCVDPDGKIVHCNPHTMRGWYVAYRKGGLQALYPAVRKDIGRSKVVSEEALEAIMKYKLESPLITGTRIYQRLLEDGLLQDGGSASTIQRYLRINNLKKPPADLVDRRAFEMEFANDLWQIDTSDGPMVGKGKEAKRALLVMAVDDKSRLVPTAQYFFHDTAENVMETIKVGILKYGRPRSIFLDNGASYVSKQLLKACANMEIHVIHCAPYSPESKAKIERLFRTVNDMWINSVNWDKFTSLEVLNEDLGKFIEFYNNRIHGTTHQAPRMRWLDDHAVIKFSDPEDVEMAFLFSEERKVLKDSTLRFQNRVFEVPFELIGQKVTIRYRPAEPVEELLVYGADGAFKCKSQPVDKVANGKLKRKGIDYGKGPGEEA